MEYNYLPLSQNIFQDLTESQYIDFLNSNHNINKAYLLGGALADINLYHKRHFPHLLQTNYHTGAGIFSFLKGLAKSSIPFLRRLILPEAVNFTHGIIDTKLQNKKLDKQTLKNLAAKSIKNIAAKTLSGGRRRKRRSRTKKKRQFIRKKYTKQRKFKRKTKNIKIKNKVKSKKNNTNKYKIFNNI